MNKATLLLTFTIVAGLAAISPPAISFYYADESPLIASLGSAGPAAALSTIAGPVIANSGYNTELAAN
ncbi:MAG TPA: hypothetical protein VKN63_03185 [Afifellaceae bacterium]|nr:hypothetical protein [Afifellaceae bacterium]